MTARLLPALLLVLAPAAARAADENPYKDAKVGDYSTYKMTTQVAGISINGTITQTVTAKSDKEVTIKTVANVNGMDTPAQEQKIDLTKPFDPTNVGSLPKGADMKVEKGKEGKEKVTVGGKAYDATWTSYSIKGKVMGTEMDGDVKAWMAKGVPSGMVKMEMDMNIKVQGMEQKMKMTMELTETGNKPAK
jgi:hypothetical protein